MPRKTLTDRAVTARNPLDRSPPYDVMDTVVPGFGMRVLASGRRTYILTSRYPGSRNPTRRALGACGALTLEAARAKARSWLEMLAAGKDPSIEIERAKRVEQRQRETRFGPVLDRYIQEAVVGPNQAEPLQRSWRVTARDMRRELAPWAKRPITDIDRQDVIALLQEIKRRSVAQSYNVWGYARSIFGWAINDGGYGLSTSPCDHINVAKLLGAKKVRDRVLDDVELAAFWRSVAKLDYPHRPAYQLLALTGLRLAEVTDASWSEIDIAKKHWTIPSDRMKGRNQKARAHLVPLTAELLNIFEGLPRFAGGEFVFTTTGGRRPVHLPKVKKDLDRSMLAELRSAAAERGDDAEAVMLPRWRNHDIRRTVRSGLSRLKIAEEVREAVLAHARPGIKGIYDHYSYEAEKLAALQAWSNLLHSIVEPTQSPTNVVTLR